MQHQRKFRLNIAVSTDHWRQLSDGHDRSLRQFSLFGEEYVITHQLLPVFAFLEMSGEDTKSKDAPSEACREVGE
jgi:hypothetical protein